MPARNDLITTAELADILSQPDLRLFDCTTHLEPAPEGSSQPYLALPGRHTFEAGHIPGADFLDVFFGRVAGRKMQQVLPAGKNDVVKLMQEELMRGGPHRVYLRALSKVRALL